MEKEIKLFLKKLKEMPDFDNVKFVILFGSQLSGKANKFSDYDFAVFYNGDKRQRFDFRIKLLGKLLDNFDIQIFQDLPLYLQKEILKGRLIYAKDQKFVYEVAYETIKRFDNFKGYLADYVRRRKELRA